MNSNSHSHCNSNSTRPTFLLPPRIVICILLSLSLLLQGANAYASWLKCYVELDEDEVVMHSKIIPHTDTDHNVTVEVLPEGRSQWITGNSNRIYLEEPISSVKLRLKVPPALEHKSVQYVIETSDGAKFSPANMCDGERSSAMNYDKEVLLVFNNYQEFHETHVNVVAAWATEHEAVRLTPKLKLTRQPGEQEQEQEL